MDLPVAQRKWLASNIIQQYYIGCQRARNLGFDYPDRQAGFEEAVIFLFDNSKDLPNLASNINWSLKGLQRLGYGKKAYKALCANALFISETEVLGSLEHKRTWTTGFEAIMYYTDVEYDEKIILIQNLARLKVLPNQLIIALLAWYYKCEGPVTWKDGAKIEQRLLKKFREANPDYIDIPNDWIEKIFTEEPTTTMD